MRNGEHKSNEAKELLNVPKRGGKRQIYGSFSPPPGVLGDRTRVISTLSEIGVDPSDLELTKENSQLVLRPIAHTPAATRLFAPITAGSLRGSIFTLTSSAVGAGMLALPLVMKNTGLVLGVTLLFLGACLALLSLNFLLETADLVSVERSCVGKPISYADLVTAILGPKWGVFLQLILIIYCFGVIVGYLLVIGRIVGGLLTVLNIEVPSDKIPIVLTGVLALPLTLLQEISSLALSSMFAFCAMMYVCFSLSFRGLQTASFEGQMEYFRIGPDFCSSATIVFFAFNCHINFLSIYSSLQYPIMSRIKKVTNRSILLQFVVYTLVAVPSYLRFKNETAGNIFNNFPAKDTLITAGKAAVAAALTVSMPLYFYPTRRNCYLLFNSLTTSLSDSAKPAFKEQNLPSLQADRSIYSQDSHVDSDVDVDVDADEDTPQQGPSMLTHVLMTVTIMALALALAINVPGIAVVFSFLGATAALMISLIFPITMYICVIGRIKYPASSGEGYPLCLKIEKIALWGLAICLMGIGVTSVVTMAVGHVPG